MVDLASYVVLKTKNFNYFFIFQKNFITSPHETKIILTMFNEMKYTHINSALQNVNRGGVICVLHFTFYDNHKKIPCGKSQK